MKANTKKRSLEKIHKLGTTEFCTVLNGDDARQILTALKNFAKTVRQERGIAFDLDKNYTYDTAHGNASDSDSDDDEDVESIDDSDSDKNQQDDHDTKMSNPNKKLKEEWMEDSKGYKVPFVGTSVAKGNTGQVRKGQWPTGFLEAYLEQSPLAVELMSDNLIPPSGHVHKKLLRQKQGKVSYAIYKAYLYALVELTTAAIPLATLKEPHGINTNKRDHDKPSNFQPKFLTVFMKDRFPHLIHLLNDETGHGRGKTGAVVGVGQLADPVLRILTNLASSSLGTSRQIVRSLDASVRDGVLKILLREPRKSHENDHREGDTSPDKPIKPADRLAVPYKTRASCLQLAIAFLNFRDPSITSYVATFGSREQKHPPGILYLALRYGFEDSLFREYGEVTQAQTRYLDTLRVLLQSTLALVQENADAVLSRRALADLLGGDALTNMIHAAICAPPLNSYVDVLETKDKYHHPIASLQNIGVEARRILFILLADAVRSPFLQRISGLEKDKLSSMYMTSIVKALDHLLCAHPSRETQNFVIHALQQTPLLFSGFFRYIKIPDVNSTYAFLAKLHFLSRIIQDGPPPSSCLVAMDFGPRGIDNIMTALIPHQISKLVLSRAFQSTNPLTVSESANLVLRAISRFQLLIEIVRERAAADAKLLSNAFQARLPDFQALLSSRSRFDPFSREKKDAVFVVGLICCVVDKLAETLPMAVASAKFDWMKLLPDPIDVFVHAKKVSQLRILDTIGRVMKCKSSSLENSWTPTARACCNLFEVCMSSSHEMIYARARSIAITMLSLLLKCPNEQTEASYCKKYEVSLWIDAMDRSVLSEFQTLLEDTAKNSFQFKVRALHACKEAQIPHDMRNLPFTMLLCAALSHLERMSETLACLVLRITARCFIFHSNPLPLAAIIHLERTQGKIPINEVTQVLEEYAHCVLDICRTTFESVQCQRLASLSERLYEAAMCSRKGDHIISKAASSSDLMNFRRSLQIAGLLKGFVETQDANKRWVDTACNCIREFLRARQVEPIVMGLYHPMVIRGSTPNCLSGLMRLVAVVCRGKESFPVDYSATNLAAMIAQPETKLADLDMFTLLHMWFGHAFAETDGFDTIGANLVRLAALAHLSGRRDKRVLQIFADHWCRNMRTPVPINIAWEAWKSYTSNLTQVDEGDFQMIRLTEDELCKTSGIQASDLFVKIHELGLIEFLQRCFRSLLLMKSNKDTHAFRVSLLSKAVDIGYDIVGNIVVLLIAGINHGAADIDSFVAEFCPSTESFSQIWRAGCLDAALIATSRFRNDELMGRSLNYTIREAIAADRGFLLASKFLNDQSIEFISRTSAQAGRLLKSVTFISGDVVQNQLDVQKMYYAVLFVDTLPHALKSVFKDPNRSTANISFCSEFVQSSLDAIENVETNPSLFMFVDFEGTLKTCLKYGISNSVGPLADLRSLCLKLVRLLVSATCHPGGAYLTSTCMLLNPESVWAMVLSHSEFTKACVPLEGTCEASLIRASEELVNLLVCCASLSSRRLHIEANSLRATFLAYSGGTTPFDLTLRRLFYLLESMESVEMPFTEKIAEYVMSSSLVEKEHLNWSLLGSSLDLKRVQATLSQFPRCVYLSPQPLTFEKWATSSTIVERSMPEDLEVNRDTATIPSEEQENVRDTKKDSEQAVSDLWKGSGPDIRYDPSFVVPLLVSALEALVSQVSTEEPPPRQSDEFARLAQALSERGGLSLCLASLCSACPDLRKLAFSGLCLFLLALDSDAGKDLKTWRDRPQLKMLVTSVQVGFVLRKAMLASKGLGSEIPKLPSLSAIFLGKASLILSKPSDDLYSAINKYFLKLSQNHGAFNDMTRLPAFMALFCSSSTENADKERHWVLQCLRDSFLEGFHMVSSCHAPELMLTTLGRTSTDDVERLLILQVLTRLLQFGEKQASHHLLDRIGLLPLLQSILVSRPISENVANGVMALVEVAVQQGVKLVDSLQRDQLVLDIRNFLVPIASTPCKSTVRTFVMMARSLSQLGYAEIWSIAGLGVSQCIQLLDTCNDKANMLEALCILPLHPGQKSEVPRFCETVLRALLNSSGASMSIILTRVDEIVRECNASVSWPREILHLMLELHTRAVHIKAYVDCLSSLLVLMQTFEDSSETNELLFLATSIVEILQDSAFN